jgi:tetratricopeptide (TPR) repeat protein
MGIQSNADRIAHTKKKPKDIESEIVAAALSCVRKNPTAFLAALLVLIGFVAYANTLWNELFWDDFDSIVNNAYIRDWDNFPKFFSENLTAGSGVLSNYWRPLLLISFSLDYHIAGLSPWVYHVHNLVWHVTASVLTFFLFQLILRRLPGTSDSVSRTAAFIAAAIFLVHPVQVEAVTYVAGRADPMHAALMLGSFILLILSQRCRSARSCLAACATLFALALLTKERAIVLPAILFAAFFTVGYAGSSRNDRKTIGAIATLTFMAVGYVFARLTFLDFSDTFDLDSPNNIGAEGFLQYLLAMFQAIGYYAELLLWPDNLLMERALAAPKHFFENASIGVGFALLAVSVAAFAASWKKRRLLAFGLLWFFLALAPSVHVYPIQGLLYEHWLYFPMLGLLLPLGFWIARGLENLRGRTLYRTVSLILLVAAGSALTWRTVLRNADWRDPIVFYEKNIALGGESARVWTNLGMAYDDSKRHEDAVRAYGRAIDLDPNLWVPRYDLGNALRDLGRDGEALDAYGKAIELNPSFIASYHGTAMILANARDFDGAQRVLRSALEKDPTNPTTLTLLGFISTIQSGSESENGILRDSPGPQR